MSREHRPKLIGRICVLVRNNYYIPKNKTCDYQGGAVLT